MADKILSTLLLLCCAIFYSALLLAPRPAEAALSRTNVGNYQSSTSYGTGSFATGSFTPPANSLLVVVVSAQQTFSGSGANTEPSMTFSDSAGLTETKRIAGDRVSGTYGPGGDDVSSEGVQVWTAPVGASPSSMTVTVDAGALNIYSYDVKVYAYTGYNTEDPIGGTAVDSQEETITSVTLSSTPSLDSVTLSGIYTGGVFNNLSPGDGWTEIHDTFVDFQENATQERTGSTSTTVAWSTTSNPDGSYGIIVWGMEIKAAADTPDAPQDLTTTSTVGGVNLSWDVPANSGGSNLETYGIWRSTAFFSDTSSATLIASIATTSTSYDDTTVAHGTNYYYAVTATNQTATSSLSEIRASSSNSGRIIRLGGWKTVVQ